MCRHFSVSLPGTGKAPHPAAVDMLLEAFGFRGTVAGGGLLALWTSRDADGGMIIEVLEALDPADVVKLQKKPS